MTSTSWHPDRPTFTATQRTQILHRDPICIGCQQRPSTQADHTIPIAEGGTNTTTNGQGLCDLCHHRKTLEERRRGRARHQPTTQRRQPEQHPGFSTPGAKR